MSSSYSPRPDRSTSPWPAAANEARNVLRERCARAIDVMLHEAADATLLQSLGAPNDVGALTYALAEYLAHAAATDADAPYAAALLRGSDIREALLREAGGGLTGDAAASLLGVTRQAVDKRRRNRQLLAVPIGSGDLRYPARQFDGTGRVLRSLPSVLAAFAVNDPWMQLDALLACQPALGDRDAFDALAAGMDATLIARLMAQSGDQGR